MSISPKNGQKDFTQARDRIARPAMRWLTARNRSAAKFRSANWLLKNMPMMAAMGKALRIRDCSEKNRAMNFGIRGARTAGGLDAEKPRLGRYPKMSGSHAPQMKNSSTIMRNSLKRIAWFIG